MLSFTHYGTEYPIVCWCTVQKLLANSLTLHWLSVVNGIVSSRNVFRKKEQPRIGIGIGRKLHFSITSKAKRQRVGGLIKGRGTSWPRRRSRQVICISAEGEQVPAKWCHHRHDARRVIKAVKPINCWRRRRVVVGTPTPEPWTITELFRNTPGAISGDFLCSEITLENLPAVAGYKENAKLVAPPRYRWNPR